MAGLLFLAFAYFAVGQAAATRNGAQTAADAAALAATQHARDEMHDGFLDAIAGDGPWEDWLGGDEFSTEGGCDEADDFAALNGSAVTKCLRADSRDDGFTVEVRTNYTVGESIVPGTEDVHGNAEATAVIEPRCRVQEPDEAADDQGGDDGGKESIEFTCGGEDWLIDLDDVGDLPDASDLFSVHLAD